MSTGVWTKVMQFEDSAGGATLICAEEKPETGVNTSNFYSDVTHTTDGAHQVNREPCAICCK